MASGIQIVNAPSGTGGVATAGERYSIHDLVFEDIDGERYKGFGVFALVISQRSPTARREGRSRDRVSSSSAFNIGADRDKPQRFVFTNSIFTAAAREVTSTGGGERNCTFGACD